MTRFVFGGKISPKLILPALIFIFLFFTIPVISYGIPNKEHPFSYHMDEWHQFTALKELYFNGPFNVGERMAGAYFYTFSTVPYLLPFWLSGFIRPYDRGYLWENPEILSRVFLVLRSFSLLHGIGTIIVVYILGRKFFNRNTALLACLFLILNPSFTAWSIFYNYNIGNTFWTSAALFFIFNILRSKKTSNYFLSGALSGLAIGTKVSALPLIPVIFVSHLLGNFKNRPLKKIFFDKKLIIALATLTVFFLVFGIPFYKKWDFFLRFNQNLYSAYDIDPTQKNPFPYPLFFYPLFNVIGKHFGHGLFLLLIPAVFYSFFKKNKTKEEILLFLAVLIFYLPIGRFGFGSHDGRILLYLPVLTLFVARFLEDDLRPFFLKKIWKKLLFFILLTTILIHQFIYTGAVLGAMRRKNVRVLASDWVKENVRAGDKLAVEGDPVYINPPDAIQNDYFRFHLFKYQYFGGRNYDYEDLKKSKPDFIFLTITFPEYRDLVFGTSESDKKIKRFWENLLGSREYFLAAKFEDRTSYLGIDLGLSNKFNTAFENPKIYIFQKRK